MDEKLNRPAELMAIAPGFAHLSADALALAFPPREQERAQGPRRGRVGVVELVGALWKSNLVQARETINRLAAAGNVAEIMLLIDSPGGSVAGVHDLHLAIARAARAKPVYACAEDLCASGAYWVASAATKIFVNPTGALGSIGVYRVLADTSRMLQQSGVDVHVIRSGKHKGAGESGAALDAEQLAQVKAHVDRLAELFIAAVAAGRRLAPSAVRGLADGRLLIGEEAVKAGLADGVAGWDEIYAAAAARHPYDALADLRGQAAVAKFRELVDAEAGGASSLHSWAREQVAARHPELAAEEGKWAPVRS